ncbi:MAG: serine/threonine-protein kinase [Acidimicrobiia bacterium]|nr:serine/threonine-protein kinase [Acidimicrobiia bacterium]
MSAAAPPPTPTIIAARYELQRRLAQGGMAEVWLATDVILDRKVAVKWLKPSLAADPIVAERFRREAIAAASLNHPNIVAVHDVFESEGRQAVVMQFVDGKSLREVLNNKKRLSPQLTCHIGTCVAAALDHAHGAGFIHRDVKPGNIMITPGGRVLLTDFGIAKGLHGGGDDDLTSDNVMMGTAKYLSPEQVRGKRLDGRADLYSLGLVLYECLAGRVPFLGETDADTALARLQRDPTDLTRLRATLPTGLVITIHQLLARNPEHRPATGSELAEKLKEAADEGPPVIDDTPLEHSPVAPYPTGRLLRAPSDVPGQVSDRRRFARAGQPDAPAAPDASPASSPAAGPNTITGEVGVVRGTDSGGADPTPAQGAPRRGRTAKGLSNRATTSTTVVAGLIGLALVVALILWATISFGGGESTSTTTILPSEATTAGAIESGTESDPGAIVDATPAPAEQIVSTAAAIVDIIAYDPEGDGEENDDEAPRALAGGDSTTGWRTVCYSSQFMGAKRGVGLVVTFDNLTQQAVTVDVLNAPYQLQFFATDTDEIPASIDGWGTELGTKAFGAEPTTIVSAQPTTPARHVLVLLNELGDDSACTSANPFRGQLREIALAG